MTRSSSNPSPRHLVSFTWLVLALPFLTAATTPAATLDIRGPAGAQIEIDGRPLGPLPLAPLTVERGTYVIRCRLAGHQLFTETVEIRHDESDARLQVRPSRFERRTAIMSSLALAGWGQRYLERPRSGWLLTVVEVGGLAAALWGEVSFTNHKDDYKIALDAYENAVSGFEIEQFRLEARDAHDKMGSAQDLRNAGLLAAGGAVVVSLLDAWFRFPSVEAGPGPAPSTALHDSSEATVGWHAGWRVSF